MDYERFKANPIITRPLPNGVSYDLSDRNCTTITLPPSSAWSSELHWHENHTEYLRVVKGSIRVRLGSQTLTVCAPKPGEPPAVVTVERYVRHEWHRADRGLPASEKDDEDVVVVESTDPNDAEKHIFFWNVNGIILDAQRSAANLHDGSSAAFLRLWFDFMITLRLFIVFAVLDNYPSFLDVEQSGYRALKGRLGRTLQEWVAHVVLRAAVIIASLLQIEAVDVKYTPKDLLREWTEPTISKSKKAI